MATRSKPKYIVDGKGTRVGVLIDIKDYQQMIDAEEELEAIKAFDAAKASGEKPISFDEVLQTIENQ